MSTENRRLVDRIAHASYLEGIESMSLSDLKSLRDEAREGELEISFERRLTQARIDILSAELERREGGGEGGGLIERLPQILGGGEGSSRSGDQIPSRAPDFTMPRNADVPRRRVEEIAGEQTLARLTKLSPDEIRSTIQTLGDHEATLSTKRKKVHEVMDRIQEEIVKRYVAGEADPNAAIS